MSTTTKKWLISSLVTFLTGFGIVFVSQIDTITLESFKDGTLVALLFVGVRAGIKVVIEYFLSKQTK
jgi:hypothetical protein